MEIRIYAGILVERFLPSDVAAKIAVSLGVGLLVGIEREWSNKDLGARTFALTALVGTIAALFGSAMAIMAMVGVFLVIAFANIRSLLVDRSLEATTSAALLTVFILGALIGQGHRFTPVAVAILTTMLLAWKEPLRRFAGGLQPDEIRSAVLLGLLALVVYPILPSRFIDKWNLINPREAWITVILVAGIGFLNYVLLKVYGARGVYLSGFLGGLVNSSAAALELSRVVSAGPSVEAASAPLLLTIVAMFARNLIILAALAPAAVPTALIPLVGMAATALAFIWRASSKAKHISHELHLESPLSLKRVLSFAGLFLIIQILSTLGERYLGNLGFLTISSIGGLVSSASTSAAAANLVGRGQLAPQLAGRGVVLASIASALINLPILHRKARNPVLSRQLAVLTVITSIVGVAFLILQTRLWPLTVFNSIWR